MRRWVAPAAIALLAGCDGETCPPAPAVPVQMSLARAEAIAPAVTRGLAVSTSIRTEACPPPAAGACPDPDCGTRRAPLELWTLPLGVSLPIHDGDCPRRRADLEGRGAMVARASAEGELVVALDPGDALVFLSDPSSPDPRGCAGCGRLADGDGCRVEVPASGLVVRDLVLDSAR